MLTFCFFNPRVRTTLRAQRLLYCSCSIRVALAGKIIWLQNGAKTCSRSCSCCFATFSNRPQFQFSLRIGLFDHLLWRYAMQYIHSCYADLFKSYQHWLNPQLWGECEEEGQGEQIEGGREGWQDRGGRWGRRSLSQTRSMKRTNTSTSTNSVLLWKHLKCLHMMVGKYTEVHH